jgi:Leucine-rich repeat (LRR) protein
MRPITRAILVASALLGCAGSLRAEDAVPTHKEALRLLEVHRAAKVTYRAIGERKEVVAVTISSATFAELNCLRAFPRLETLSVENTDLNNKKMVAPIAKLLNLRALDLANTNLDRDGLRALSGLTKLDALNLNGNRLLGHRDVEVLLGFPKLRLLGLRDLYFTDAGALALQRLPRLEELDMGGTKVTDKGLAHLGKLPLRRLRLGWAMEFTDAGLAHLARIKTLEELDLSFTKVTGKGLGHLRPLASLKALDLRGTDVGDSGLEVLQHLPLRRLNLRETKVTDAGLKVVARCKTLRCLELIETAVGDAGVAHLLKCEALEELDLDQTAVGDTGVDSLAKLKSLRSLSLGRTKVTDGGVARLAGHPSLRSLWLRGLEGVTNGCLPSLALLRSLTDVNLEGTAVTKDALRPFLKKHPKVRVYSDFPELETED